MERDSAIDFESSKWTSRFLILVLLLSLVLVLWSQSPYLWDKYRVIKDVQNFYWMARYWDPDLFPVDHVYLSSGRVIELDVLGLPFLLYPASLGYALLFYPATLVLDYIWVSKMLIFVLMPLCIVYLFKLGKLLRGNRTALSLSLLFVFFILASPQSISIASGLQRGFAVPMLIAFLYYMTARKHLAASLMVLVALLIYAPDFPLMVLAYTLSMVKVGRPFKPSLDLSRHRLVPFGLVLLVSLLVLGLMVVSQRGLLADLAPSEGSLPAEEGDSLQDSVGEKAPLSQDPQYQTEGSMPLFDVFPWFGRAGMFDMGAE